MNITIQELLDVEKPVLTKKLAPKLAPFAKIIYIVGLFLMALFCIRLIGGLLSGANFSVFLFDLLMLVAEFAVVRMFCEYLATSAKSDK